MSFKIIGVHPIESAAPCHIVEVQFASPPSTSGWNGVTQELSDQPRSNWQAAYDEQPLDEKENRWVFFFHYLDFNKPLLTPFGQVSIPAETPLPEHLKHIEYIPP